MCEKCVKLDSQIDHYKALAAKLDDGQALAAIEAIILECERTKRALHPENGWQG